MKRARAYDDWVPLFQEIIGAMKSRDWAEGVSSVTEETAPSGTSAM